MFIEPTDLMQADNKSATPAMSLLAFTYNPVEVRTISQLSRAMNLQTHEGYRLDADLRKKLQILINNTHRAGSKLFVTDFQGGPWCLVAPDLETVRKHQRQLMAIDEFQAKIIPDSLWGKCIFIHEYARISGLADGVMLNGQRLEGESIFQIRGIHNIGYMAASDTRTSIYFDLSSMAYIFTAKGREASHAICRGLAVIEPLHSTRAIQGLYSNYWNPQKPWGCLPCEMEAYEECFTK